MQDGGPALRRYGVIDFGGYPDITGQPCMSIDLRQKTGAHVPDESAVVPAGTFRRALFAPTPGEWPTGEIRLMINGQEVRLVAEPTGRRDVIEITPNMIESIDQDPNYRAQWRHYLGVA